jgi:hypothetical protein
MASRRCGHRSDISIATQDPDRRCVREAADQAMGAPRVAPTMRCRWRHRERTGAAGDRSPWAVVHEMTWCLTPDR